MTGTAWKFGTIALLTVVAVAGISIPIGGTFSDASRMMMAGATKPVPVQGVIVAYSDVPRHEITLKDRSGAIGRVIFPSSRLVEPGDVVVCDVNFSPSDTTYPAARLASVNPPFVFPFIPGLEERARIIFFHVPMSWVATVAFFVSMAFGIGYLRTKRADLDVKSAAAAGLGLLFALLATLSGSIWAKFNWGSYWNWDPRETSIFILLLVYGAYFALRSALEDASRRAALSAVYSILAAVTVPFFIFIMPRLIPGLHPGSQGDVNSGPVVSGQIEAWMRITYISSFIGFIGLFAWLFQLRVRIARLEAR